MDVGVFIPIANNGWLISKASPQYHASFALNRDVTLLAEKYGFEFALSMIKLRGFGGETEFWDHALESFTLMAGHRGGDATDQALCVVRRADPAAGDRRAHGLHHRQHRAGPIRDQHRLRLGRG